MTCRLGRLVAAAPTAKPACNGKKPSTPTNAPVLAVNLATTAAKETSPKPNVKSKSAALPNTSWKRALTAQTTLAP